MLAVLAAAGERGIARERVAALLWPESDAERARSALSQTLYALRRDVGAPGLVTGMTELRLDPSVCTCDLWAFEEAVAVGDVDAALALVRGPFLDGVHVPRAPEFESWVTTERLRIAGQLAGAVEHAASVATRNADHARALVLWRRRAADDPLSTRVAVALVNALNAAGDPTGALAHARAHAAYMREDLGVLSLPDLDAAVARARAGVPAPRALPSLSEADMGQPVPPPQLAPPAAMPADLDGHVSARSHRERRWQHVRQAAVAVGVLMLCGAALTRFAGGHRASMLDAGRYAVLPFEESAGLGGVPSLDGLQTRRLLAEALGRWRDVRLVDDLRFDDALLRDSGAHSTDERLALAARFGAGRAVAGRVWRGSDAVRIEAVLYDVGQAVVVRRAAVRVGTGTGASERVDAAFAQLAADLLVGGSADHNERSPAVGADAGTHVLGARLAYERGRAALARWDLEAAADALRAAVAADPEFAAAHLWLAQTLLWHDDEPETWRGAALRAVALRAALPTRAEAYTAEALVALADGRYPDACAAFRAVIAADSSSFVGWYGLGECQRRDHVVVPDAPSPTGWRFRSSAAGAAAAYVRALTLVPSFHLAYREGALDRLGTVFYLYPRRLRMGQDASGTWFAAYPELAGDSLTFYPAVLPHHSALPAAGSRVDAAIERQRAMVRTLAEGWVNDFPTSAGAWRVYAFAAELRGDVVGAPRGRPGALAATRRARQLGGSRQSVLALATDEVRLLLKSGDATAAAALVDSLLEAAPPRNALADDTTPDPTTAHLLAPVAALTGRIRRAAAFAHYATNELTTAADVPSAAQTAAAVFALFATFEAPADSVRRSRETVEALLAGNRALRIHVLSDALRGVPVLPAVPASPIDTLWAAAARGDVSGARRLGTAWDALTAGRPPASRSIQVTFFRARAALLTGDSSAARSALAPVLDAYAVSDDPSVTRSVVTAAAFGRAVALRAELAAAAGDRAGARRWAQLGAALWRDADPELRGTVARLRALAAS